MDDHGRIVQRLRKTECYLLIFSRRYCVSTPQEQEQEQEKEEVVMDEEPEEYVKMKYSREDEAPHPWAIKNLASTAPSSLGFYPASEFGVLTKLIQQVGIENTRKLSKLDDDRLNPR